MKMNSFTDDQREALLDLATLAMYADGHLAAAENDGFKRLLKALGFETEYDQAKHYDASVCRVRRQAGATEAARTYANELAQKFTTREQRRQVDTVLDDLMASDNRVAPQEATFLSIVREALKV